MKNEFIKGIISNEERFSLWSVIGVAIDDYYLGVDLNTFKNLIDTFERDMLKYNNNEPKYSASLESEIRSYFFDYILPSFRKIKEYVYSQPDVLDDFNSYKNGDEWIGCEYNEWRMYYTEALSNYVTEHICDWEFTPLDFEDVISSDELVDEVEF